MLSERIAARLGLIPADVRLVEFLVREHLFMSHTSQRRDLEDVSLVAHFAKGCENEEKLRQLFLLTFCDLASTGPKTMTHWKSELMAELFERTLKFMRRGADLLQAEQAELVQERQRQAALLLAGEVDGPALADLWHLLWRVNNSVQPRSSRRPPFPEKVTSHAHRPDAAAR